MKNFKDFLFEEKKITISDIKKWYDIFNKKYFSNELPNSREIEFKSTNSKKYLAKARFQKNSLLDEIEKIIFIISKNIFKFGENKIKGILLHEMIHIFLEINNVGDAFTHGYSFHKKRIEIEKKSNIKIPFSDFLEDFFNGDENFEEKVYIYIFDLESEKRFISYFMFKENNKKLKNEMDKKVKELKSHMKSIKNDSVKIFYGKVNLSNFPELFTDKISHKKLEKNLLLKNSDIYRKIIKKLKEI